MTLDMQAGQSEGKMDDTGYGRDIKLHEMYLKVVGFLLDRFMRSQRGSNHLNLKLINYFNYTQKSES